MSPEQESLLQQQLKEELEKTRLQGMTIGMKAVSKVVYDKVINVNRKYSKNDLLRVIKNIKEYCETGLNLKEDSLYKDDKKGDD